jgi:hypothetical protein
VTEVEARVPLRALLFTPPNLNLTHTHSPGCNAIRLATEVGIRYLIVGATEILKVFALHIPFTFSIMALQSSQCCNAREDFSSSL